MSNFSVLMPQMGNIMVTFELFCCFAPRDKLTALRRPNSCFCLRGMLQWGVNEVETLAILLAKNFFIASKVDRKKKLFSGLRTIFFCYFLMTCMRNMQPTVTRMGNIYSKICIQGDLSMRN